MISGEPESLRIDAVTSTIYGGEVFRGWVLFAKEFNNNNTKNIVRIRVKQK